MIESSVIECEGIVRKESGFVFVWRTGSIEQQLALMLMQPFDVVIAEMTPNEWSGCCESIFLEHLRIRTAFREVAPSINLRELAPKLTRFLLLARHLILYLTYQ